MSKYVGNPKPRLSDSSQDQRQMLRGTLVNVLGLAGKAVYPALIVVLTRLFGAEVVGIYFLGLTVIEVSSGLVATGWADACTIFASRRERDDDAEAYEQLGSVLAKALVFGVSSAFCVALAIQFLANWTISTFFHAYQNLVPGVYFLGWSLIPLTFAQIISSAARAQLKMEWDAINFGLRPVLLVGAAVIVWALGGGLTELLLSFFIVACLLAFVALVPLCRELNFRVVFRGLCRPRWDLDMVRFAIPQSLNQTVSMYITRLDTMMLAAFGTEPARLAWYATASFLTSNLQQVRIVFTSAMMPLIARYHHRGERNELTTLISKVARWTGSIIIPICLILLILRDDVLSLVDPSYRGPESIFFVPLLISPLTNCTMGLAGAFIAATGHSGWNLFNSIVVGALNTVLNALLIPAYGLLGAAMATGTSMVFVGILQMIELKKLENIVIRIEEVWMPLVGLAVSLLVVGLLWDPAYLGTWVTRCSLAFGLTLGLFLLFRTFGHPELRRSGSPSVPGNA